MKPSMYVLEQNEMFKPVRNLKSHEVMHSGNGNLGSLENSRATKLRTGTGNVAQSGNLKGHKVTHT